MENIYLHAINPEESFYDISKTLKIAEQILKDGQILTRRELEANGNYPNKKSTPIGFSGLDYVSLCDYSKRHSYGVNHYYHGYTSYDEYVKHSISFGFSPDLEVIRPNIITPLFFDTRFLSRREIQENFLKMERYGMSEEARYSDFPDEVQHKGNLPLDKLMALTLHIKTIAMKAYNPRTSLAKLKTLLEELKSLLIAYQQEVSILELDTLEEINNEDELESCMRKYTLF